MQETLGMWFEFLGQEDPLEKEIATCSSILAWRILWTEEPAGLQSMGLQRVRQYWACTLCPSIASGPWASKNDRWFFTPSPWGWSFWGPAALSGLGFDTSLLPKGFAISSCWEAVFLFFVLFWILCVYSSGVTWAEFGPALAKTCPVFQASQLTRKPPSGLEPIVSRNIESSWN